MKGKREGSKQRVGGDVAERLRATGVGKGSVEEGNEKKMSVKSIFFVLQ